MVCVGSPGRIPPLASPPLPCLSTCALVHPLATGGLRGRVQAPQPHPGCVTCHTWTNPPGCATLTRVGWGWVYCSQRGCLRAGAGTATRGPDCTTHPTLLAPTPFPPPHHQVCPAAGLLTLNTTTTHAPAPPCTPLHRRSPATVQVSCPTAPASSSPPRCSKTQCSRGWGGGRGVCACVRVCASVRAGACVEVVHEVCVRQVAVDGSAGTGVSRQGMVCRSEACRHTAKRFV